MPFAASQPLRATNSLAGLSLKRTTGGLAASVLCWYFSNFAPVMLRPSSSSASMSLRRLTRGTCAGVTTWGATVPGTLAEGMFAAGMLADGTAPAAATTADGVCATGCGWCSLFHSIHIKAATINQAKIRNVRVWVIGQAGSADALARHFSREGKVYLVALCRPWPVRATHRRVAAGAGTRSAGLHCLLFRPVRVQPVHKRQAPAGPGFGEMRHAGRA